MLDLSVCCLYHQSRNFSKLLTFGDPVFVQESEKWNKMANPRTAWLEALKEEVGYPLKFTAAKWPCPVSDSSADSWVWNSLQSAPPEKLVILDDTTVVFHPKFSRSTGGIRGTRLLNGGLYYWEILLGNRVYGSAMMIGISTTAGRVESPDFDAIVGEDQHSWGLSHRGYLHHNGEKRAYCPALEEHVPTVIGVLFDGRAGTVTFFKEGRSLGLAFKDLHHVGQELYPMVSSTACKTVMRVQSMRKGHYRDEYHELQDRCRDAILASVSGLDGVEELLKRLPLKLRRYVMQHLWKINGWTEAEDDPMDGDPPKAG